MSLFKELRIEAKMNVASLTTASGVSRSTIQKMDKGLPVRPELAQQVCEVLATRLGRSDLNWKTAQIAVV